MSHSQPLESALEVSPLTVLVRGVLEWACPHAFLEDLFDHSGARRSVFAAFQADQNSKPTDYHSHRRCALYQVLGGLIPASLPPWSRSPPNAWTNWHENLRWRPLKPAQAVGRIATGEVGEQTVEVEDTDTGRCVRMRRIILQLDTATTEGEPEIVLLTNLRGLSGLRICELNRDRWSKERHFALVKTVLRGELESLGCPGAAIFVLCLALVASNALAVVKQALRTTPDVEEFEKLSGGAFHCCRYHAAVPVVIVSACFSKRGFPWPETPSQ
jgi:hypothetical protein